MIPFQAVLTPLFLELHYLYLLDSLIGPALCYTTFNLPVGVYVMRNSFLQVPREIVNASRVDGASVTRTLLSVRRPLVLPGMATSPSTPSPLRGRGQGLLDPRSHSTGSPGSNSSAR